MDTLEELLEQQRNLQKQIEDARAGKKEEVIKALKAEMAKYGITAEDLGFQTKGKKSKKGEKVIKYRNPANDKETYGGKGPHPDWLKKALEAGKTLEDFKIPE